MHPDGVGRVRIDALERDMVGAGRPLECRDADQIAGEGGPEDGGVGLADGLMGGLVGRIGGEDAVVVSQRLAVLPGESGVRHRRHGAHTGRAAARDLIAELGLELAHGRGVAFDLVPLAGRAERLQTIELAQRVVEDALPQLEQSERLGIPQRAPRREAAEEVLVGRERAHLRQERSVLLDRAAGARRIDGLSFVAVRQATRRRLVRIDALVADRVVAAPADDRAAIVSPRERRDVLEEDLIPRRPAGAAVVVLTAVGARPLRARAGCCEAGAVLVATALATDAVHVEAVQDDRVRAELRGVEGRDDVARSLSRLRCRVGRAAAARNELVTDGAHRPMHHQKAGRSACALGCGLHVSKQCLEAEGATDAEEERASSKAVGQHFTVLPNGDREWWTPRSHASATQSSGPSRRSYRSPPARRSLPSAARGRDPYCWRRPWTPRSGRS